MAALLAAGWQFSWFAAELISPHFQVVGASVAHAPAVVARPLKELLVGVPAHGERHADWFALGKLCGGCRQCSSNGHKARLRRWSHRSIAS